MKRTSLFPLLGLLAVAVLMFCPCLVMAQRAGTAVVAKALVEIVGSPPTVTQPVAIVAPAKYALNTAPVPVAFRAQTAGTVSPWSGAFFYDAGGNTFNAVVLNKITDLTKNTRLAGFGLYGFAGTTLDRNGKAIAGIAIGKDWKWFDQISFFTGLGVSFAAETPIGGGVIVGASLHF